MLFFDGVTPPPTLLPLAAVMDPESAPYSSLSFFLVTRISSRAEAAEARPATDLNFS